MKQGQPQKSAWPGDMSSDKPHPVNPRYKRHHMTESTYGRDLLGDLDALEDRERTLLERALEVDVAELLTEVGSGADEPDKTVLHDELDVGAVLDGLEHRARGLDEQLAAWLGRVGRQVDVVDGDGVAATVGIAELEGVVAGNLERVVDGDTSGRRRREPAGRRG